MIHFPQYPHIQKPTLRGFISPDIGQKPDKGRCFKIRRDHFSQIGQTFLTAPHKDNRLHGDRQPEGLIWKCGDDELVVWRCAILQMGSKERENCTICIPCNGKRGRRWKSDKTCCWFPTLPTPPPPLSPLVAGADGVWTKLNLSNTAT